MREVEIYDYEILNLKDCQIQVLKHLLVSDESKVLHFSEDAEVWRSDVEVTSKMVEPNGIGGFIWVLLMSVVEEGVIVV